MGVSASEANERDLKSRPLWFGVASSCLKLRGALRKLAVRESASVRGVRFVYRD